MESELLKRLIIDQREEIAGIQADTRLLERECVTAYRKLLSARTIKVITGVRRCGKSTLACQLLTGRSFAYLNFDDERLVACEPDDLNRALEIFYEVYGKFDYVFLD